MYTYVVSLAHARRCLIGKGQLKGLVDWPVVSADPTPVRLHRPYVWPDPSLRPDHYIRYGRRHISTRQKVLYTPWEYIVEKNTYTEIVSSHVNDVGIRATIH